MASKTNTEKPADDVPDRVAAYGLLASITVVLIPHVARFPLWLSGLLLALFVWRFMMLQRGWPMPSRLLRYVLTIVAVMLVYRHYGTIFGRDAGSSLLALMLALKLLELRRLRDYMLSVFLIYFLIAIGFLYSQELWLVLYLIAAFVASTATLMRLALTGLSAQRALRTTLVVLAQALPLVLLMHLLFPRLQGSLWGMPSDAYAGQTGMSETMQPGSINSLSMSDEIAFRAYFPDGVPPNADLYWRVLVLNETDGQVWKRGPVRAQTLPSPPTAQVLHYSIAVEPSNHPWLPSLGQPTHIPERARLLSDMTLEMRHPIRERLQLDQESRMVLSLQNGNPPGPYPVRNLPPLTPRVLELARTLQQGRSPAETVRAGLAYFREQPFYYTLEPPLLGDQPVDEFLFETRRGFCEHYASAYTLLMRAAGIPARVVTGYQGGEFSQVGNYLIVRQSDAHAWVEVWLEPQGWVRVDPTNAVAPERIEYGSDALRRLMARGARLGQLLPGALELGWFDRTRRHAMLGYDLLRSSWQRWVLGYNAARQSEFLKFLGFDRIDALRLLGLLILMIAAVFAASLAFAWWRRPRPDPAQRLYLVYCRRLGRVGLRRESSVGPLRYARECAHQRPDLEHDIKVITKLYIQLRYRVGVDPAGLRQLASLVAAFRPRRLA